MSGLLRICTAGSVDDGKSTLIGRLLHDSQSVYEDQIHAVEKASKNRNAGPIDFSLFTDGLKAEREQGITIDVAYRYFATAKRKFILADTPGHEQYTRNMATGASTADLAILLIDARQGVRVQSRRHARIARLLGITDFVLAINKMDLVDFDRDIYDGIRDEFEEMLAGARVHAIPLSALHGDNVITRSERTPWFEGPSLLEYLETVEVTRDLTALPFRFPVQLVLRPNHDFRGYAGQIASGVVRVGDTIIASPSGRTDARQPHRHLRRRPRLRVRADVGHAHPGRRDRHQPRRYADAGAADGRHSEFEADVVWMDERPADPGRVYLIKQSTRTVTAEIHHGLVLNQIGTVNVSTARPLVFDRYSENRATGSFIVIDPATHFTAGAGMILNPLQPASAATLAPISAAERLAHLARRAGSDAEAVEAIRAALEELLS